MPESNQIEENPTKIDSESIKTDPGGALKRRQKAKMKKNVPPSNSAAPFWTIFKENGVQVGPQNEPQINKQSIQISMIF